MAHGPDLRIAPDGTCRDCGQQLCIPSADGLQLERNAIRHRAARRRPALRTPGLLPPTKGREAAADLWDELALGG